MKGLTITELYTLEHTKAEALLAQFTYPWEVLPEIGAFIKAFGAQLCEEEYEKRDEFVWVSKSAKLFPNVYIAGPAIIGHGTEIRPGAFIRGNAFVGENCVVGNSTELKNVLLFDGVQVPHYNYVGDSVLGYKAHMGAGAITSNVKQDKSNVSISTIEGRVETGLRKFGAMLGDNVEVGCSSVLNPGTVIGKNSHIYPLSMVRGFVPRDMILKNTGELVEINRLNSGGKG